MTFIGCAVLSFATIAGVRAALATKAEVEYWEGLGREGVGREVAEKLAKERAALEQGPVPIATAMQKLSRREGRRGFPAIKPEADAKAPPVTGWMHHPDFQKRVELANTVKRRLANRGSGATRVPEGQTEKAE